MRAKDRFRALCGCETMDRPWRFETVGFWTETLRRWRGEGLPRWVSSDPRAYAYFHFDPWIPLVVGDHRQPGVWPPIKRVLLRREGDHEIWRNEHGGDEKIFADGHSALPHLIRSPVETMADLRRYLPLLDPNAPGRFSLRGDRALIHLTRFMDWPLGILFAGLFATYRYLLGLERFMLTVYDAPEMLHEIARAWERHVVGIAKRLAARRPLFVSFWEDMCYRNGMFISPKAYREFITPYFHRAVQELYDTGVEFTLVDSDGDVTKLIPLLEEVGIKGMMPFEVQSGMDIREIRRRHPRLVIFGGLDKRLLAQSREAMEKEIEEKAVPLLRTGGYVPGFDHAVPPDISLADFRWCLKRLRGLRP